MRYRQWLLRAALGSLGLLVGAGCAGIKEVGKGFLGVSTKVLEEGRENSLKQTFPLSRGACYAKIKEILRQKDKESPIYAQNKEQTMIALYLAVNDTTPVGVFLTPQAQDATLVEISSPSTYAKEEVAARIFTGLNTLVKSLAQGKQTDAQEKKADN